MKKQQTGGAAVQAPPPQSRRPIAPVRTDPEQGLTSAQAAERTEAGYANTPVEAPTKTEKQIIRENVFTFFNLIFVVLAVCLALVGDFRDMLFLVIAIANTLIGIIQEIRSKHTIDKLTLLSAPKATVVRDGKVITLPVAKLVRDDVVVFSAGSQIPADAVMVSGSLQVNEALITGEPDAIPKAAGDELLSGSFVVAGSGRAVLTRVGTESYASRLTLEAKKGHAPRQSEMMNSLDKLIRIIGIALIPMGVALFVKQYFFLETGIYHAMTSTVAALIGMIPEGLYLLTSVALAVSVLRLARKRTLVHDMSSIETLARVDVLCVDKTGTITEPGMAVAGLVPLDEELFPVRTVEATLNAFYAAADADNDTAKALKARFSGKSVWKADKVIPFTSATKWSAVTFVGHGTYVVGAPEFVMGQRYADLQETVEEYSGQGERVLLLAKHEGPITGGRLTGKLSPMALIRIANKIRPEAPDTFRYFAQQGVAVKVISGDNPVTVSQVALQAGIQGAEQYVDAATLKSDADIARAVEQYTVFGRVTPSQKRKFVQALKKAGHTVAMTGDGVNDVLALKDADCGIAMASGADAACQAAHLVLLDSNFASMPQVVLEGRRVINNIQRAASLFLVKNIFSFLLSLITIFAADMPYPFVPLQLSLISALTIGVPSFFLALEPNRAIVKGRFLPNVMKQACPGGLTNLFLVLGAEAFAYAFGFSTQSLSTISAMLMAFNGLIVLFYVCRPFDWKRRVLWGAMTVAMVVCVGWFGSFFSLEPLTLQTGLVFCVLLLLAVPCQKVVLKVMEVCALVHKAFLARLRAHRRLRVLPEDS